jgi:hypothetical protein
MRAPSSVVGGYGIGGGMAECALGEFGETGFQFVEGPARGEQALEDLLAGELLVGVLLDAAVDERWVALCGGGTGGIGGDGWGLRGGAGGLGGGEVAG